MLHFTFRDAGINVSKGGFVYYSQLNMATGAYTSFRLYDNAELESA